MGEGDGMTGSPGIRGGVPSDVPDIILQELCFGPADADMLVPAVLRKRRTVIYHLNNLVKAGKVEKIWNLKNLRKPLYRLKARG